jgi:hypothetical protein
VPKSRQNKQKALMNIFLNGNIRFEKQNFMQQITENLESMGKGKN